MAKVIQSKKNNTGEVTISDFNLYLYYSYSLKTNQPTKENKTKTHKHTNKKKSDIDTKAETGQWIENRIPLPNKSAHNYNF